MPPELPSLVTCNSMSTLLAKVQGSGAFTIGALFISSAALFGAAALFCCEGYHVNFQPIEACTAVPSQHDI
jgi:hypothetical protein